MNNFDELQLGLNSNPKNWLITGVAGFIGSNLLEALLRLNQNVVGLDNFITGYEKNLDEVCLNVTSDQWSKFNFINGDIQSLDDCLHACNGIDYVLHQAALGSVPRSIMDPIKTNSINVDGFLNMLVASRDKGVKTFTYASSSSVYGDHPGLPKIETRIGRPLSPYAVTKRVNEMYADTFSGCYGLNSIGLRYFNVFGPRQDPNGAYAAVIPRWISALLNGENIHVNGDGKTSRDFCYVTNVVQANILAATTMEKNISNKVFNVAVGGQTTLTDLYKLICEILLKNNPNNILTSKILYKDFRSGDIRHSVANISNIKNKLGYSPTHSIRSGLEETIKWYKN